MSDRGDPPVRLGLRSRIADSARLLPFLCLVLMVLPAVILPGGGPDAGVASLAWLFGAWGALLFATFLVARAYQRAGERDRERGG